MLIKKKDEFSYSEITPKSDYLNRRITRNSYIELFHSLVVAAANHQRGNSQRGNYNSSPAFNNVSVHVVSPESLGGYRRNSATD